MKDGAATVTSPGRFFIGAIFTEHDVALKSAPGTRLGLTFLTFQVSQRLSLCFHQNIGNVTRLRFPKTNQSEWIVGIWYGDIRVQGRKRNIFLGCPPLELDQHDVIDGTKISLCLLQKIGMHEFRHTQGLFQRTKSKQLCWPNKDFFFHPNALAVGSSH